MFIYILWLINYKNQICMHLWQLIGKETLAVWLAVATPPVVHKEVAGVCGCMAA
jgi:hypothetical protein